MIIMTDFTGEVHGKSLVLQGTCVTCHGKVARVLEGASENAVLKPGDKVIWWKRMPGGDYVYPVQATVLTVTAKRVKSAARDDGERMIRSVPVQRLQRHECPFADAAAMIVHRGWRHSRLRTKGACPCHMWSSSIPSKCPRARTKRFWQSGKRQKPLWNDNPATLGHGSTGAWCRTPGSALLTWQNGKPSSTFRPPSITQSLSHCGMRPPLRISLRFTR